MTDRLLLRVTLSSLFVLLAFASTSATPAADLYLQVTIVTGEHGRDSNSLTRTLTVSSGQLTYNEIYLGARAGKYIPVIKQFQITKQDEADLIALLKAKNLQLTKTISKQPEQKGYSRYFQLAIVSALEGRENSVAIEASPAEDELKQNSLYQGSVEFIRRLYEIIARTHPEITMPALLD